MGYRAIRRAGLCAEECPVQASPGFQHHGVHHGRELPEFLAVRPIQGLRQVELVDAEIRKPACHALSLISGRHQR